MRRRTFLAGLGFAALQLAGCGTKPQTTPDYVLTYADNQPAGYPTTQGAQYFADLVQQQTGGKVVIQVKSGGEYGTDAPAMVTTDLPGCDMGYNRVDDPSTNRLHNNPQLDASCDYNGVMNGTSSATPNTTGAMAVKTALLKATVPSGYRISNTVPSRVMPL